MNFHTAMCNLGYFSGWQDAILYTTARGGPRCGYIGYSFRYTKFVLCVELISTREKMNIGANQPAPAGQPVQHAVMLPCSPDQFSEFIAGLLGKPQTISQELYGSFEMNKTEIENIHHLLHQRITQQNNGDLLQFTSRIIFDDDSSVLLNSIDDLMSYNEVRPVSCKQVHLSWAYLIQFNGKTFPEKQSIDISFVSVGDVVFLAEDGIFSSLTKRVPSNVAFRIQHTARTWGADIQALLDNHLRGLLTFEGRFKTLIRKYHTAIQLLFFVGFLLCTFLRIFLSSADLMQVRAANANALAKSTISLDNKINGLILALHNDPWQRFLLSSIGYIIFSIVAAFAFTAWMESVASSRKPSFILLSPMSEKKRKVILDRYNGKWFAFGLSVVTSIITGLISSVIYAYYWT
jgi:hypothetical protein